MTVTDETYRTPLIADMARHASELAQPLTETESAAASGRSDLVAEAADLIADATYVHESYDGKQGAGRPSVSERIRVGDGSDAARAHAGVLLEMEKAESLAALTETVTAFAARQTELTESLAASVETAGQNTTVALGQIVAQLEKLNENLDAHRVALVDTAGELRAEVEYVAEAVGHATDEVREVGLAVDRVGTSIDCLDTEAQTRNTKAHERRVSAARGLLLIALLGWGVALTLLAWAWISTTDPQLPEWMAPAGFGAGGVLALIAALLTGASFGRSGEAAVEPTPSSSPVVWGGGVMSEQTGSGKSAGVLDQVAHRLADEDATVGEARS